MIDAQRALQLGMVNEVCAVAAVVKGGTTAAAPDAAAAGTACV